MVYIYIYIYIYYTAIMIRNPSKDVGNDFGPCINPFRLVCGLSIGIVWVLGYGQRTKESPGYLGICRFVGSRRASCGYNDTVDKT